MLDIIPSSGSKNDTSMKPMNIQSRITTVSYTHLDVYKRQSKFWFEFTKDVVPNHMISVDAKDMPEFFGQDRFNGNSMLLSLIHI